MEAKLVVVGGKANKSEVKLKLPAMIGRSRDADITVSHASVSRHHCLIYEVEGALVVRDNGSLNGTVVDGQKIQDPSLLRPGQSLTIGPLTFRADYDHDGGFPVLGDAPAAESNGQARAGVTPAVAVAAPPPLTSESTVQIEPALVDEGLPDMPLDPEPEEAESGAPEFGFLSDEPEQTATSSKPSFSFLGGGDSADAADAADEDDSGAVFRFAGDPPPAAAQAEEKESMPVAEQAATKKAAAKEPAKGAEDAALNDFLNSLGLDN